VIIDLHSHSTASDGVLSPRELIRRAAEQGVNTLALTDHDEVSGLAEAAEEATAVGVRLVAGVEISTSWSNRTIHVVGLRIDVRHPTLTTGLAGNRAGRDDRARRIGAALAKTGIGGAYEGAYALAGNKTLVSRTHFARFLVEAGHVKDVKTVFKKFLVKGKPGYVEHRWADLADAVTWIRAAGGVAVLAHPGRYDLGSAKLDLLIEEFKVAGGAALEVVSGSHHPAQLAQFADLAVRHGLLASAGSDFHGPGEGGRELGRLAPLPARCTPVWLDW